MAHYDRAVPSQPRIRCWIDAFYLGPLFAETAEGPAAGERNGAERCRTPNPQHLTANTYSHSSGPPKWMGAKHSDLWKLSLPTTGFHIPQCGCEVSSPHL